MSTNDAGPPDTGAPNDEDVSSTPSPANTEMAQAIFADGKERKQKREEEFTQAERDKQAIFDALESETCHIRVMSTRVECSTLSGEEESWLDGLREEFLEYRDVPDEEAEEEMSRDEYERYKQLKSRVTEILIERSVEDTFDTPFWNRLPFEKREKAIADLSKGGIEGERGND